MLFVATNGRKIRTINMPENITDVHLWIEGSKFITVSTRDGIESVIFPDHLVHKDVYMGEFNNLQLLTAGFISNFGVAYGKSYSLNSKPASIDDSDCFTEFLEFIIDEQNKGMSS